MLLMVLHEIADDQIGINQPRLAHGVYSLAREALAAASRICVKDIPRPFLLASVPLSCRMPGCTRIVARSSSTSYSNLSPGLIPKAFRTFEGTVVCPLLVIVECSINK